MTEQERILQIEQSLAGLEKQLYDLKFELNELKESRQPGMQTVSDIKAATVDTPAQTATVATSVAAPEPTLPPKDATGEQKPTTTPSAPKANSASRFEENIGGKVMGIVAAVLVFVGLFLFGSMLYERLGDTARVAILFVVSFLILGAGLFLERKRKSRFTTSLVGCGFGAVYISLFFTALYYGMFTKEVLYILLLFWLISIGLYVFHRQSFTVALLGQIGIAFSVVFGCLGAELTGEFTFLCIYFVVLSLLYLWIVLWRFLPTTKDVPYSWIHLVAAALNLIQLFALTACYDSLFGGWGSIGGKNWTAGLLLCLYCFILPLFFLLRQRALAKLSLLPWTISKRRIDQSTFSVYKAGLGSVWLFTVYQIMTWIVCSVISGTLLEADTPRGLFILSGLLLSYVITEVFGPTGIEGRGAGIVNAVAVCFILMWSDFPSLMQVLIPMVFCTITFLFGILGSECPLRSVFNADTKRWESLCKQEGGRCFAKFTSCVYILPIVLSYGYRDTGFILFLITVFCIAFFVTAFVFLYRNGRTQRFGDTWKVVLYLFAMYSVAWISTMIIECTSLDEICVPGTVLTILVACNCVAFYSGFRKKLTAPDSMDPAANLFVRLIHTALWIFGIAMLRSGELEDYPFLCVWIIVLTLYLCGSGLYEQYILYRHKTGIGIYFGLRITLYMLAVITAFDGIEGYVISCVLLVLAILAVLSGFPLRLAPLRIYGLCLAMFAVVKLLMIDVEHDNSMETVLCFLGAGILCFAINFIYNHVKKRFNNIG